MVHGTHISRAAAAVAFICLATANASAQSFDEMRKRYDSFKQEARQQYDDFRKKANEEYVQFIRDAWQRYEAEPAQPAPQKPKPPVIPTAKPVDNPQPRQLPVSDVIIPDPVPATPPQPVEPIPQQPASPTLREVAFDFYGTPCTVRVNIGEPVRLGGYEEQDVADMWQQLTDEGFDAAIADCLQLRSTMNLCDWAYLSLTGRFAETYCGHKGNDAVVVQAYVLTQSGYKVRMARANDRLTILMPSENEIWSYSFIKRDDCRYYILDRSLKGSSFYVCDVPFPGEKFSSLYMQSQPSFAMTPTSGRQLKAERYPQIAVTADTNEQLMEFYNSYPLTNDWDMYAYASLSDRLKGELYPVLRKAIDGKSEAEAANMLLNFVQTAFDYKTDDEQFGYERPLFGDETFYYPYSDCEDRSILFSILVRDLLDLDAALVSYPNHLATAVCFTEYVKGDYIVLNGRRYTVCDPTYIGADIGMTMPDMDNASADVILLNRQ